MLPDLTAPIESRASLSGSDAGEVEEAVVRRLDARVALAAVVLLAFAAYAALAHFVRTPRIFYDELVYMEAAASLAAGDGLEVRDQPYDYGVLYPAVLAPLHWLSADREVAYELSKLLNALLFALTAVPVYLLARRLLSTRASVVVAALSVVVPSSVYVTVVMTESLAYLVSAWAILAIVLALERPTVLRQLAALLAIGLAVATRPQFALLYLAFLGALAIAFFLEPGRRSEGPRRQLARLWPTLASAVVGLAVVVLAPLARGDSPREALGGYDVLYRTYDLASLAKWFVWHLSALELYLAVVPIAVAPITLALLVARARSGSERDAAFVSAFGAVNLLALAVAAAVVTYQESPGLEIDRLHDRYLFYVVPLWLILLAAWIQSGAPRTGRAAAVGVGCALILAATFPFHELDLENGVKLFSAVGTALPAAVKELAGSTVAAGIAVVVLAALVLAAAYLRSAGAAASTALRVLVVVFVLNGVLVFGRAFNPPEADVFAGGATERLWVDERVPEDADVTVLQSSCEEASLERDSYILTEFFNASVRDVVLIDGDPRGARVGADGVVVLASGRRVEADYVVAQPGLGLAGEMLSEGTSVGLALWDVPGLVRVSDLGSATRAGAGFCFPSPRA